MREKDKYTERVEDSLKLRAEAEQARERVGKVKKELRELYQDAVILLGEARLIICEGQTQTRKAIVG